MSTLQLNDVKVEQGEGGLVTLRIEVAPETVRIAREKALRNWSKRLRVPGFRPGHVPISVVRRNVGDENIAQSISDDLIPKAYQAALEQAKISPLDRASVDELAFDAFDGDKPLTMTAHVIVRPDISLGDVEGLALSRGSVEVSDADVEERLQTLGAERATLRLIEDRGAQSGDVINADLQVFVDGEPRGEEAAHLGAFILGESGFTPSIDEHLIDARIDEERRFTITYPEGFQDAELAGKEAEFAVTVTALRERVLPEINDEFAKSTGAENLEALRVQLREFLTRQRQRQISEAVREQAVGKAVTGATLEVPSKLVESRAHHRFHAFEEELAQRQTTLDDYLASNKQTREEFEKILQDELTVELRQELVLDEIARVHEFEVSQDEVVNHYQTMAMMMRQPVEQLVQDVDIETVRATIRQRKAIDFLVEKAAISEE